MYKTAGPAPKTPDGQFSILKNLTPGVAYIKHKAGKPKTRMVDFEI